MIFYFGFCAGAYGLYCLRSGEPKSREFFRYFLPGFFCQKVLHLPSDQAAALKLGRSLDLRKRISVISGVCIFNPSNGARSAFELHKIQMDNSGGRTFGGNVSILAKRIYFLFLLGLFLTACEKGKQTSTSGSGLPFEGDSNGSGYGGQPRFVEQVVERMVQGLNNFHEGFNAESFGKFSPTTTCQALGDPHVCEKMISPTVNQRAHAVTFLKNNIDKLRNLPMTAKVSMVTHELHQLTPKGIKIPVTALAELGGVKVFINTDSFRAQSPAAQVVTLTHEYLHLAAAVDDFKANGPWANGAQMLDFIGAAAAAHYLENLGKVVVTFPTAEMKCYRPGLKNALLTAPYFQPPTADEIRANANAGGQVSLAAKEFVNNKVGDKDFTVSAWVKFDEAGLNSDEGRGFGRVILSNFDQAYRQAAIYGLALYRSHEGNFVGYAGTYLPIDSGLTIPGDGKFHHVVIRKNTSIGKISTFVDGVGGNEYSDKYLDENETEWSTSILGNRAPGVAIGRAGLETGGCVLNGTNTTLATVWTCLDPWAGHVTQAAFYNVALSADAIKALYECGVAP